MPFQWRVGLYLVTALLIALFTEFGLGFLLFERALSGDLSADLTRFRSWVAEGLIDTPRGPALNSDTLAGLEQFRGYARGRGRVLGPDGTPLLLIGGLFPKELDGWMTQETTLENGYTVEVAMSRNSHNVAVKDYLRASLLALPILTLVLGLGGWWLAYQLLRPLRGLRQAVTAVSGSADLSSRVAEPPVDDELGRLARSYNAMMDRLERFFERERTFTRYASHELRNPLTALRVQVDAALSQDLPVERVLTTLKLELARLSDILNGLLILARDPTPPQTPVDLAGLLKDGVDRARLQAADDGLLIDYQGPDTLPFQGDGALLGRMIDNLLENAVKYGATGQVTASLENTATAIRLRVEDQGPGVPEEVIDKLTTPFFRVRDGTIPGSGLGLSVVRRIAEVHRGDVYFENLEPQGFAVTLSFPKRPEETAT